MKRIPQTILLVMAALSAGCESAEDQAPTADASSEAAALSFSTAAGMETLGTDEVTGVAKRSAVWRNSTIPVCWEAMDASGEDGRRWTREAIEGSWESNARIDFVGWGQCPASSKGVRIEVADAVARTRGFGNELKGEPNGMRLNFTMQTWNASCLEQFGLEKCIRVVGIHEFGHALALAHEQNRPETAEVAGEDCARKRRGAAGDLPLTPWDESSVMNYCNPLYGNGGELSAKDIKSIRQLYGLPIQ